MKMTKNDLLSSIKDQIKSPKLEGHNTIRYVTISGITKIRYCYTDIITYEDNIVTLNNGGWLTKTTKDCFRKNGFNIFTKNHIWYLVSKEGYCSKCKRHKNSKTYEFYNGMKVRNCCHTLISKKVCSDKKAKRLRNKIRDLCNLLTKENIPSPSLGDCLICQVGGNNCLLSHIKEKYLHGSLILRALKDANYSEYRIAFLVHNNDVKTLRRVLRRFLNKNLFPYIKDLKI